MQSSLLLLCLLRTWLLWDGTLRSGQLLSCQDFLSANCGDTKLLLDLGLLGIELLLLLGLEALNLLLVLLVVGLSFLLLVSPEGRRTSHLVFNLGLLGVEFFLGLFSLGHDNLVHLLVVGLSFLLDGVELFNVALLSLSVLLGGLIHKLLLGSSLLGCLALSDELHLVVVIFGLLLNIG